MLLIAAHCCSLPPSVVGDVGALMEWESLVLRSGSVLGSNPAKALAILLLLLLLLKYALPACAIPFMVIQVTPHHSSHDPTWKTSSQDGIPGLLNWNKLPSSFSASLLHTLPVVLFLPPSFPLSFSPSLPSTHVALHDWGGHIMIRPSPWPSLIQLQSAPLTTSQCGVGPFASSLGRWWSQTTLRVH